MTIFINARGQLVAALQLVDLVFKPRLKARLGFVELLFQRFNFRHRGFIGDAKLPPLAFRKLFFENLFRDDAVFKALRPGNGFLAKQKRLQAAINIALKDREFVVAVFGETFNFLALNRDGALILVKRRDG